MDEDRPKEATYEFLRDNVVHRYRRWGNDGVPNHIDVWRYHIERDRLTFMPLFDTYGEQHIYLFRFTTKDTMVIQYLENNELQGSPTLYARSENFELPQPKPIPTNER